MFASVAYKNTNGIKNMKVRHNALQEFALMLVLLLVGAQSVWADLRKSTTGNDYCSPKIHFKLPSGWNGAYLVISGKGLPFPKADAEGWTTMDLAEETPGGKGSDDDYFYINGVNKNDCNDGMCVTTKGAKIAPQQPRVEGFSCKTFTSIDKSWTDGSDIWIGEHPDAKKAGQVYITTKKPVVVDFYVFLPDNKVWKSATPMINEDGTDHDLYVGDVCGWYYRRYIDEDLPTSALVHRDDDEKDASGKYKQAIGNNGAWEDNPEDPTPIPMSAMFDIYKEEAGYNNAIYFVADEDMARDNTNPADLGWSATRPDITGTCSYSLAAIIYDTDASLHPSFSCYSAGGEGCQAMTGTAAQGVAKATALAAIDSCIGVTPGLVESTLDPTTKKPKLSKAGKKCFMDEKYFNQLFNYTEGVNEKSCFDMPFTQATDGKWEFDSDYYTSPGLSVPVQGGFYPVEGSTDASILAADPNQKPVAAARTKRMAEGPVYYGVDLRAIDAKTEMPKIDIACKGPGWNGGKDCEGIFADGEGTEAFFGTSVSCVFGWSCPQEAPEGWPMYKDGTETRGTETARWRSEENSKNGGRNQHFCFESHANFRYKKGLKFNFRGDDDIWVFIDNKLAVDLGGTHLAAPGYVDLDYFMPSAKVDSTYDIDIFFCDRRTTMSNVRIKTNMFIEQTTGIEYTANTDAADYMKTGNNHYELCYKKSGDGSCAAKADPTAASEKRYCGPEIEQAGIKVSYIFSKEKTGTVAEDIRISETDFEKSKVQAGGGIDVTDPGNPIINRDILKNYFPGGKYYLIVRIGSDVKAIEVKIVGSLGVANRVAIAKDENDIPSLPYEFISQKMASSFEDGVVDPKQLVPLYVAAIMDPCTTPTCNDTLEMQLVPDQKYKLNSSNPKVVFYEKKDGKYSPFEWATTQRTVPKGGIDTVYITIPFDDMGSLQEPVAVNVVGSTRKAEVTFFEPEIAFVSDSINYDYKTKITADHKDSSRLKGSPYDFYVGAYNLDHTLCTDCNFKLGQGAQTSPGVNIVAGFEVVNGRAVITVQSGKTYERETNGTAKLVVTGPDASNMVATYEELQFIEPPVPTPQFADIFDVHGAKPASEMNVPTPYFSVETEYLDGIADSLVIYYSREFHKDSLPEQIVVNWSNDAKDSVLFTQAEVAEGSFCGTAKGASDDDHCKRMIVLKGKNFSKSAKTSGTGKLKSRATFTARGAKVTKDYEGTIYDRVAPVILSARASNEAGGGENARAQLRIVFSEKVQKTDAGAAQGDNVFSFYINSTKESKLEENIALAPGVSFAKKYPDSIVTLLYTQNGLFPQAGDYLHVRGIDGVGLIMDQADTSAKLLGADTLRPADDASFGWNVATAYNPSVKRLPSPWVLITGDVSAYAVRLLPGAKGKVPLTPTESAKLPSAEILTFDAFKDQADFEKSIKDGTNGVEKYGFVPHGWYVKSDMGSLLESKEEYAKINKGDVYFEYEMQIFSNLGSHVITKKGRIYCDDAKNQKEFGKLYYDGKNCVESHKNFYILWNMKSKEDRLVGSGAYISKLKSHVVLGPEGKKNKNDKTEMWGVRHGNGKGEMVIGQ